MSEFYEAFTWGFSYGATFLGYFAAALALMFSAFGIVCLFMAGVCIVLVLGNS